MALYTFPLSLCQLLLHLNYFYTSARDSSKERNPLFFHRLNFHGKLKQLIAEIISIRLVPRCDRCSCRRLLLLPHRLLKTATGLNPFHTVDKLTIIHDLSFFNLSKVGISNESLFELIDDLYRVREF